MKAMRIFPLPGPPAPGVRVFRAWRWWQSNVCGATVAAMAGGALFLVLGGILIGLTEALPWISVVLILDGIAAPLVLLLGKVAAYYPYAVEVEAGKGLRFYSPLGKTYIPIEEVKQVRPRVGGCAVILKKRYGLISSFLIHVAWGPEGRELVRAIEEELADRV